MKKKFIWMILITAFAVELNAHDEGHARPDKLPPIGPHGGKYTELTRHYAEIVVKGNQVKLYILERDVKAVAEDATNVSLELEVKGKKRETVQLTQDKNDLGYAGTINIPSRTRVVHFHIKCMLDGKWETGKLLHEVK